MRARSERRGSQHDQLGAALRGVLDPGRGDRVVHRRVGADQRARPRLCVTSITGFDTAPEPMPSSSAHHRRRMAQPRAVVDVVAAEAGAHQLLEQVGLFVAALGRAEAGERLLAVRVANPRAACRRRSRAPLPTSLRGTRRMTRSRVHHEVAALRRVGAPDQRLGQPLRMVRVVEAVAALDAQPLVVGRAVAAFDVEDLVVLDVVGQLAADAAVRADRARPACRAR